MHGNIAIIKMLLHLYSSQVCWKVVRRKEPVGSCIILVQNEP